MGSTGAATEAAKIASWKAGENRRKLYLDEMLRTGDIHAACAAAGVALGTYHKWRGRFPEFAAQVDALRAGAVETGKTPASKYGGTFADFSLEFFGHKFSWFHLLAADAFANAQGGDVIMFLWPPEHGKTTLAEDFDSHILAVDPSYLITVGSESKDTSEKILGRVRTRMEPDGPAPAYVKRFGPFAPVAGRSRQGKQPWAADHFNVFKKGVHDSRDYNMQALGVKGSVIGSRAHLLQIDDMQSSKNATVANTELLLNVIRGDWLSRPGVSGHTVINGSRQSPVDILQELVKQGIVDRLIKLPAYDESRIATHGTPFLWYQDEEEKKEQIRTKQRSPEGGPYTEREYARLQRNAGPERWDLTYLQKDGSSAKNTFREEHWGPCINPMRSILHDPPKDATRIIVSLDPAIGSPNGVLAAAATYRKLYILGCVSVPGLTNNDQVLGLVEEYCHQFQLPHTGQQVTDVIIESKAYQKALMDDRQLHKMQDRFGFRSLPHDTGLNKYDENLGVPQMVYSMLRNEIDFPYADEASRGEMDGLFGELGAWRPHILGKKLRMDRVMVLWFAWMFWRNIRNELRPDQSGSDQFKSVGLPWAPTSYTPSGLAIVGGR